MTSQFADGTLSAKRVCEGAWHLGDAAAICMVGDLARSPTNQSGSFARHLDHALGLDPFERDFVFTTKIPQQHRIHGKN